MSDGWRQGNRTGKDLAGHQDEHANGRPELWQIVEIAASKVAFGTGQAAQPVPDDADTQPSGKIRRRKYQKLKSLNNKQSPPEENVSRLITQDPKAITSADIRIFRTMRRECAITATIRMAGLRSHGNVDTWSFMLVGCAKTVTPINTTRYRHNIYEEQEAEGREAVTSNGQPICPIVILPLRYDEFKLWRITSRSLLRLSASHLTIRRTGTRMCRQVSKNNWGRWTSDCSRKKMRCCNNYCCFDRATWKCKRDQRVQ